MTMNLCVETKSLAWGLASRALLCLLLAVAVGGAQAQSKNAKFRGEPVTLNFVNADIEGVTRAVGAIVKQQFIVDPRVKGNITLYSEEPLSPREVYLNYLAALRGLGFTVVEVGGMFKVVPEADAKLQTGVVSTDPAPARQGDSVVTQIFRLNHENANTLVAVLRPLISPNNTINATPGSNTLVVTDYADNLQRIAKIIAAMDTPTSGDVEVIPLQHAVAADVQVLVQRLADSSGQPGAPGGAGAAPMILVDQRSNSLIVRAANPARLSLVRSIVEKLDRPTALNNGMGNIWVVYLKNADAVKLAAVLRAAFTSGSGGGGGAASPIPSTPNAPAVPAGAPAGASPQATAPVSASAQPSTGGFIQADPATNSLIITASLPLYQQLRNVIEKLDSRRAQVYIESLIVKVDAEKMADIGIQWQAISGDQNSSRIVGGGTNYTGTGNIVNLTTAINEGLTGLAGVAIPPGLNIGVLKKIGDFWNIGALARFLETKTDANVLATPNMVSLDNEEAKIVVGQNVPFLTGSYSNTGGNGAVNPFQTIERKDVGLTLRIKPQIGESGTIRLVIYQENSTVVPSSRTSPQGLTTDKSAIETTVVVDDGQIMVLGGLLKDEYGGGVSQVPFLGDLPIVGPLFRTDTRTRTKSNLMVFLRPMVIRNQDESNALSMDRYDLIRAQQGSVGQPRQSVVMPINDAPIAPPATQLAPGSPLQRGQVPPMLALPDNIPVQPKPAQSAPAPAPAPIPGPTSPN